MNDYKSTLNLPKTKFSMKGNLKIKEEQILKQWNQNNLYEKIRIQKNNNPIFFLHDGPPYANGNIHIGHAINKVLKDIILKSKNMSGFNAPYIPCWDCHGLPIEQKVEELIKKNNKPISKKIFREKCREYAKKQVENQKKDFIRLGVLGDWDNPYLTMDYKSEADIIRTLSKIIENGHLYKGLKPVHWCLNCESSLADAEVEYYDKKSSSILFKLKVHDNQSIAKKFKIKNFQNDIHFTVWTTTPWTLPSSQAIAVNEKYTYQLIQTDDCKLIIMSNLTKLIMQKIKIKKWKIIGETNGKNLEFENVQHPLLNINIPIILSTHVSDQIGTGIVHIAPDHGIEDFLATQPYKIKPINLINANGTYINNIHSELNGINIINAETIIIKIINNKNILLLIETINHSYPHCWRHKTPIIFRTTPQWFISMTKKQLKLNSLKLIDKVKWIPEWGKNRMLSMLKNRPDWCISRQRKWGVPITLFIHKKTGELHPKTKNIMEKIAKLVEINGIEEWWNIDTKKILGEKYKEYFKSEDILDVWFDSGSSQNFVINQPIFKNKKKADIYVEGSDQHRGWFMSSLIISTAIKNTAPYHAVLTHGFAVDNIGKKMSKSTGNSLSPNHIIKTIGADVLRLWVASTDYSKDISISNEILQQSIENYRKIRNTARFILSNLYQFDPEQNIVHKDKMIMLDKWAVNKTKETQIEIIKLYKKYNFHELLQKIMNFCSVDMSAFYFEIIKDRQYTTKKKSLANLSGQTALFHIINALVRWIAPILSFTAEEIWEHIPGNNNSIFFQEWYKNLFYLSKNEVLSNQYWNIIIQIKNEVNKSIENKRNKKIIKNSLESSIILYVKSNLFNILSILKNELKFIFLTSDATIQEYHLAPKNILKNNIIPGLKIYLYRANGHKCQRCWHYFTDINQKKQKSELCFRCILNIEGNGETRYYC
ncbi:Isoleucine--tRNA ligase [Buchnera aphidicola (Eriosoma grossulariae)]|uniref:isoleucine--tRNA ligase n=1 Tax=Buchnera aphidicola TaxID=9 RepID=UPI003463875F